MNKTHTAIALLIVKDYIEKEPNFYQILFKIMKNDLFCLMSDNWDIERVDLEKPHLKETLNDLAFLLSSKQIDSRHAKQILEAAWDTDQYVWDMGRYIIDSKLLEEVDDLRSIVQSVTLEEEKAWEEFKSGKQKVISRLIGKVMGKTQGKADPNKVKEILTELGGQ